MKRFTKLDIFLVVLITSIFFGLYGGLLYQGYKYKLSNNIAQPTETIDDLLSYSYTIRCPSGAAGSGTVFNIGGDIYVLTAGHVVRDLLQYDLNEIITDNTDEATIKAKKRWTKPSIEKTIYENGREVAINKYSGHVVLYSPVETQKGLDLALIHVDSYSIPCKWAKFLDTEDYKIGESIYHIGSLYGEYTESYVEGHIARLDYQYEIKGAKHPFIIAKLGGCSGSSGGGVFVKRNGKYYFCGMLTRGDYATTMLVKPSYIIKNWLKTNKINFSEN